MGIAQITQGKAFKQMMSKLYGLGAAIVIIGALFKIQHWEGAGIMLTVGLLTEAVIFFFSAFEPPHEELDWTLVYPELAGMHEPGGHGKKKKAGDPVAQELDRLLSEAKIGPDLIASLDVVKENGVIFLDDFSKLYIDRDLDRILELLPAHINN
jgi:gliding motility-associated protein GldL